MGGYRRSLLGAWIGAAALVGCGSVSVPSGPTVQSGLQATRPAAKRSWMAAGAAKQPNLLYVSNSGSGSVTVYTYLNGGGLLLVGTLSGFSLPAGMCTDKAGDVFIPDYGRRKIFEYAHGGSTRYSRSPSRAASPTIVRSI